MRPRRVKRHAAPVTAAAAPVAAARSVWDCSAARKGSVRTVHEDLRGLKIGGWEQIGYHNKTDGLFNTYPGRVQLQQSWLYLEKKAEASECCWDWGVRIDAVYGTDGPDTQALAAIPQVGHQLG